MPSETRQAYALRFRYLRRHRVVDVAVNGIGAAVIRPDSTRADATAPSDQACLGCQTNA
jgi:hypothetical protein